MKTNKLLKTALLSVCLMGGVSASWAEKTTVNIPTTWGSYITWDNAETNCTIEGDNAYVGNTNADDKYAEFDINNTVQQDYIMTFATGSMGGITAELNVVVKNSSNEEVLVKVAKVEDTGYWTNFYAINHYLLENLPIGSYTLRISVKSRTATYAGNWSKLAFYATSNYDNWPLTTSSTTLDPAKSNITTSSNPRYNSETKEISYIQNGSFIEFIVNNETAQCYQLAMALYRSNHDVADVDVTITDIASGSLDAKQSFFIKDDNSLTFPIANSISTGWKKVRFDFSTSVSYVPNITSLSFTAYTPDFNALPLKGIATLNLNPNTAFFNDCTYESGDSKNNIGNIRGNKPFADFYFINNTNEAAYYDLYANISYYKNESTLKVTVTDLSTGEEESTGTSDAITATGVIHFALNNAITPGRKSVRFDFVSETTEGYLCNVKEISFYKRSLNEAYTYSPVAATGVDVVLTRSITAGNWSTIVLPFAMTAAQLKEAFGDDVKVAALTSGDATTLNFMALDLTDGARTTTANQPYAIKVASDFTSATISGVTIVEGTTTQSLTDWDFVGTYESGNIPDGSYFFSGNKLWQASGDAVTIKPFRAYFTPKVAAARQVLFVIEGEEGETSIGRINADGTMETVAEGPIFNLAGQRVANPSKGLYIVNGKKVIIK